MDQPRPSPLAIAPELARRLSTPGPRYTSYPPANLFSEEFGPDDAAEALGRLGRSGRPVSLYTHLPFCRSLCHYCACNVIITKKNGAASDYLDLLEREVELVAGALGARPRASQVHLGGGTPTYLTCDELRRLHAILSQGFDLSGAEEMAVEVDPRVTSREQLATLAELGWNRTSFGVQDFDPEVQRAINRVQSLEQTERLLEDARDLGYSGINLDLIYGLPYQRPETFRRTLAEVVRLRPERIALYSYAHVPWMRVAQNRFVRKNYPLPGPEEKAVLFSEAVETFGAAGYRHLGMDHFALPSDELARAQERGTLHRNFQGYTVRRADDLVGLGASSIGDYAGVYAQNVKELEPYREAVNSGRLPVTRGWHLTEDDLARRDAITALMTGSPLAPGSTERFQSELAAMDDLVQDGLVRRTPSGIEVTPLGRFFIRNVAMRFDRYIQTKSPSRLPMYSQTV